jgi:hypothetical protein
MFSLRGDLNKKKNKVENHLQQGGLGEASVKGRTPPQF